VSDAAAHERFGAPAADAADAEHHDAAPLQALHRGRPDEPFRPVEDVFPFHHHESRHKDTNFPASPAHHCRK
jgi:hypothetical protein